MPTPGPGRERLPGGAAWLITFPFTLCILLTLALLVAHLAGHSATQDQWDATSVLAQLQHGLVDGWFRGFTDLRGLAFTLQMCLMLLTGGAFARAYPVRRLLDGLARQIGSTSTAVFLVSFLALTTGLINWGFS